MTVPPAQPESSSSATPPPNAGDERGPGAIRGGLLYCGLCGALNPATNHFCAACGTTLVDAFHGSEGLRVYERPDSASRLVEIVAAGGELDVVEDPNAPEDFVRVRLRSGKLGYIRLHEVEALAAASSRHGSQPARPDINTNARGCVTPGAALGALALLVVTATLGLVLIFNSASSDSGLFAFIFCVGVAPFMLLTIGVYLFARGREDRQIEEDEDSAEDVAKLAGNGGKESAG